MMKNILLCLFAIALCACEDKNDSSTPIKVGTDSTSLTELTLHPQSRYDLLLSGGNHKYTVNVANSRLASAFIYAFCTTKPDEIDIKAWGEY